MEALNHAGQQLADHLKRLRRHEVEHTDSTARVEKVNVVGAGRTLTAAYEQLRNAAENTEEHLLLQNAIRRFYRQLFITRDENLIRQSGNELAVELTLAGYLQNDTLTRDQVAAISDLATRYYSAYEALQRNRGIPTDRAFKWTLDVLAVEVEGILNDPMQSAIFVDFAYAQMDALIKANNVEIGGEDQGAALYVAVHEALLKSNPAVVRTRLLRRYQVGIDTLEAYVSYNQQIDKLLESKAVDSLYRIVDRQGAPLRILRRMMDARPDFSDLLSRRAAFLEAFEKQVNSEYERVGHRLNRAIVRSIIFLVITKFLIGLAVEVPYDYWAHGHIVWLPLVINLLFPPIYMLMLRATLTLPGFANTTAMVDRADAMLYGDRPVLGKMRITGRRYGPIFSAVYVLISLIIFAAVIYGLLMLDFSLVHIAIFFVFLSAASFLGFRLSRNIREIEVVRSAANGMTFVRDMLYLPFVVIGQWMSDKYSRVNIITIILDMMIELPLKTVLRLVRQWAAFIDDRKDNI